MPIRLFIAIILLSLSAQPIYAEAQLKVKTWSFSAGAETNNKNWLPKDTYSNESSGSTYFYVAPGSPGYEGSSWGGFFVPFQLGRDHFWWNTGSILLSGSAGYRHVLAGSHLNQNWFAGVYFGYGYDGKYKLKGHTKSYYKANIGIEMGGSKFGQLTFNVYGGGDEALQQAFNKVQVWDSDSKLFKNSQLLDNWGVSFKWVSVPNTWRTQLSLVGALTSVYSKMQEDVGAFKEEWVGHLGVGCECTLNSWAHIELRWALIDKYQASLCPSFGIKLIGVKPHLSKATFQGRLRRPSQYYTPMYAFKWNDWLEFFDSIPDKNKTIRSNKNNTLSSIRSALPNRQGALKKTVLYQHHNTSYRHSVTIVHSHAENSQPSNRGSRISRSCSPPPTYEQAMAEGKQG